MPKVRIPLAQPFSSRDGTIGVIDTYVENGYLDKNEQSTYVIKRDGTELVDTIPGIFDNPQGALFFNGFTYVVYGDVLYRTGAGANTGANGITWTQAPMPVWYARANFSATVFQERIYVIGGFSPPNQYADISYTSDGVLWSTNAGGAPFGHRQGHQTVVFNNQLFLIAGYQNDASFVGLTNDVWSSSDGATWTQLTTAAAFSPREGHTVVVGNNGMYLYGGGNGVAMDDVWFSVDGITWTNLTMAATGTGRKVHSSMFFQNKIYIIGGVDSSTTPLNDVWSSPDGQTWTLENAAAWAAGRYDMASTIYNNQMWLIGGIMGVTIDANVYSSSDGITWTLITVAPGFSNRGGAEAVTFKTPSTVDQYRYDTMWLLGGSTGSPLQEVWRADLNSALATSYNLNPSVILDQLYSLETFENGTKLLIKNSSNFWILESGTLTPVVDTNYPAVTVPGIVVLNSFAYVMTPEGEIRSCAINDPTQWPSLQFIYADYSDDPGVAIIKFLNYLVAFGTHTTQFFYDAGNPAPGTAISPYQSASVTVGCAVAGTLQLVRDTLVWVGQTSEEQWGVYMMNGISPQKISSSWVDKALEFNVFSDTFAFVAGNGDHIFYVLIFLDSPTGQALAYDFGTKTWHPWSSNTNPYWPYFFSVDAGLDNGQLWIGAGNLTGKIYFTSTNLYDDDGTPFDLQVQTDKIDAGNLERKYFGQVNFVSDTTGASVLVEVSDDDYNSYTTWGTMTLATQRPYLNRGGSARRRAFRITQTDSLAARWEAIELNASQGES